MLHQNNQQKYIWLQIVEEQWDLYMDVIENRGYIMVWMDVFWFLHCLG